jgi:hypothetical protein
MRTYSSDPFVLLYCNFFCSCCSCLVHFCRLVSYFRSGLTSRYLWSAWARYNHTLETFTMLGVRCVVVAPKDSRSIAAPSCSLLLQCQKPCQGSGSGAEILRLWRSGPQNRYAGALLIHLNLHCSSGLSVFPELILRGRLTRLDDWPCSGIGKKKPCLEH